MPSPLQDVAVSLQGYLYRRQRFGRSFQDEYAFLKATEFSSALQLELIQAARLRRMLTHVTQRVPFYRGWLSGREIDSIRPGAMEALQAIPVTEKSVLRERPTSFLNEGQIERGAIAWNTSGTTGSPMRYYYSPNSVSRQYAFVERYREEAGVNRRLRRAQFTGKLIAGQDDDERVWRFDLANNCLLLSTVHLHPKRMGDYLDALRRFRPVYISGYPSAIALLAQEAQASSQKPIRMKAALSSAETLLESQRSVIERAFGARVHDQYGQTEMQSFWFECRYGRMHAHPLFGMTEILRPDGRPCETGETGDVVLTGFLNSAMPLVRYRVGDRAAWSAEQTCACGRQMPIIASLEGRKDDYIFSYERGLVGRMDPVLKGVTGIRECQFIQDDPASLRIVFVAEEGLCEHDMEQFRLNLRRRLGESIALRFEEVSAIPRGPNGKFRSVVSHLPKDFAATLHAEEIAS
jgi:phenylacetate-CoA ligase